MKWFEVRSRSRILVHTLSVNIVLYYLSVVEHQNFHCWALSGGNVIWWIDVVFSFLKTVFFSNSKGYVSVGLDYIMRSNCGCIYLTVYLLSDRKYQLSHQAHICQDVLLASWCKTMNYDKPYLYSWISF